MGQDRSDRERKAGAEFTGPFSSHRLDFICWRGICGRTVTFRVVSWLDSTWCPVVAYVMVALLAMVLGSLEIARTRSVGSSILWPNFWFGTAVLLVVMAVGRATDTGEFLADLGRQQARSEGWYETRRGIQAAVIGTIAAIWLISIILAIWRVPARRRRYLPMAIVVFTIVCYNGTRVISLHQVDAIFHNREIGGVTIGAVTELSLLACALVVELRALWLPPRIDTARQPVGSDERQIRPGTMREGTA